MQRISRRQCGNNIEISTDNLRRAKKKKKYKELSEKLTRQLQRKIGVGRRMNGLEVRTRRSSESKEEEEKRWYKSKHSTGDL